MRPLDIVNMGFLTVLINEFHSDAWKAIKQGKKAEALEKIRQIRAHADTVNKLAEKIIEEEEASKEEKLS